MLQLAHLELLQEDSFPREKVLSLLALLVQKYKYCQSSSQASTFHARTSRAPAGRILTYADVC
jgi:hypothetical protein